MRFSLLLAMIVPMALAGCDQPSPTKARHIEVAEGGYEARIQALNERQRNAVFLRAIRDAGRPCQNVEESRLQGRIRSHPYWSARCEDDGMWIILLGNGGVAQIASAAEMKSAR